MLADRALSVCDQSHRAAQVTGRRLTRARDGQGADTSADTSCGGQDVDGRDKPGHHHGIDLVPAKRA